MYRNILLSCTLAIGDVVMATAAAALLKKIYPGVKISFMVKALAEEIVVNNPVIDEVIAPKYAQKKLSPKLMGNVVRDLQEKNFDLFVSLDGKLRPALLAWLAGIPARVGPTCLFGSNTRMPLLLTHNITVGDFKTTHYIEVLHQMLGKFCGTTEKADPVLPLVAEGDRTAVDGFLSRLGAHRYLIGLCVKTNPLKTWPKERFAALIDRLAVKYDAAFYVIGQHHDRRYVDELGALTNAAVANFCGETTIPQLMEMLQRTDLFISLDTAPMHIASVLNTPMLAIFGSTAVASVAPLSAKAVILAPTGLACIPCIPNRVQVFPGISKRIAPSNCADQLCMQQITVDMAATAAEKIMELIKQV